MASEFAIRRQPAGLRKLVIVSSLPSMELWDKSNAILKKGLAEDVQAGFKVGFGDPVGYRKALEGLYAEHGCRVDPPPDEIFKAVLDPIFGDGEGKGGDPTVTVAM